MAQSVEFVSIKPIIQVDSKDDGKFNTIHENTNTGKIVVEGTGQDTLITIQKEKDAALQQVFKGKMANIVIQFVKESDNKITPRIFVDEGTGKFKALYDKSVYGIGIVGTGQNTKISVKKDENAEKELKYNDKMFRALVILEPQPVPDGDEGKDKFGIWKKYPTKSGGIEWFMDMNIDKLKNQERVSLRGTAEKKNGYWLGKVTTETDPHTFRIVVQAKEGIDGDAATPNHSKAAEQKFMASKDDWKNVEVTGYFYVEGTNDPNEEITMYCRGGTHNDDDDGCRGTAYKPGIQYNGKPNFLKEYWHGGGDWHKDDGNFKNKEGPGSIIKKWVGQKAIVYDKGNQVKIEVFYHKTDQDDLEVLPNQDGWKPFFELVDDGDNMGSKGKEECKPKDNNAKEIFTWGGPVVTFRTDDHSGIRCKWLSVREIQPPS